MKILVVCSKHFYHKIPEIKNYLEQQEHKITLPNSFDEPFSEDVMREKEKEEYVNWKRKMLEESQNKIKGIEMVLVLNFEKKGIPNYIGGATFLEIYEAWKLNKKIFFYNPLPNCSFTDELVGMNPQIINGNLSKIK